MAIRLTSANSEKMTTSGLAPTGDIVFECWLYPITVTGTQHWFFMIGNASADYIAYTIGASGDLDRFTAQTNKGGSFNANGNADITANQWYYFRGTRKSSDGVMTVKAWNASDLSVHSSGTVTAGTGAMSYEGGASVQIGLNIAAGGVSYFDGRIRNAILITSGIPTDAESLARAQASNPILKGPNHNTVSNFWPMMDADDTRDLLQANTLTM